MTIPVPSTARAVLLLVATGTAFGLHTPLARIAAIEVDRPLGLAFWVNVLTAAICLSVARLRGRWPRLTRERLRFVVYWGLAGAALAEMTLFAVATVLPGALLSLIVGLEGFMVYLVAAAMREEPHDLRRLTGLMLGLVAVVLLAGIDLPDAPMLFWLMIALVVPATYAFEDLWLAAGMPRGFDPLAAIGFASVVAAIALGAVALATRSTVPAAAMVSSAGLAVLLMAASAAVGTLLLYRLLGVAGAVFGSQCGQIITIAGVCWSLILLGERPSGGFWPAFVLICLGLVLVGPRRVDPTSHAGFVSASKPTAPAPARATRGFSERSFCSFHCRPWNRAPRRTPARQTR